MALTFTPLGSDNFAVNANPLNPAKWTEPDNTGDGFEPLQALSGFCVATSDNPIDFADFFTGISAPNDQYASVTLNALVADGNTGLSFFLRSDLAAANTYGIGIINNGDGTTCLGSISVIVNTAETVLAQLNSFPYSLGDVFTCAVVGETLYLLQNGNILLQTTDSTFSSGLIGLDLIPFTTPNITAIKVSNFVTGSVSSGAIMAATTKAMYSQNSSQLGKTIATAFPQVKNVAQNLDLIQIASKKGNQVLAVVDYQGTVLTAPGLTLTSVSVSGTSTTYTGTITGGTSNGLAGKKVVVTGFTNGVNNGVFFITSSTLTTFVVTTVAQVNETKAANALPYTKGTRVGRFTSNFKTTDTYTTAALFADTFANPSKQDILQIVNLGGNVHYFLNYQGVASGS